MQCFSAGTSPLYILALLSPVTFRLHAHRKLVAPSSSHRLLCFSAPALLFILGILTGSLDSILPAVPPPTLLCCSPCSVIVLAFLISQTSGRLFISGLHDPLPELTGVPPQYIKPSIYFIKDSLLDLANIGGIYKKTNRQFINDVAKLYVSLILDLH